jgi:hypothetical protein
MKLFHFYRIEDHSGVSGTGPVVEGVEFTNGWCALRWCSSKSSICFYKSLEDVKSIHGHGGKTEIVVHDLEPLRKQPSAGSSARFELLTQIIEETSRLLVLGEDPDLTRKELHSSINGIKSLLDELERKLTTRAGKSTSAA